MKAKFFYFPYLLIILLSCNNPGTSKRINNESDSAQLPYHIDLEGNMKNIKPFPLSSISKKIEYIPLETTANSLIGRLDGLGLSLAKIIFSDSFIFISDGEKVLQFDRSGKFIKQISTVGRGPGQYLEPINFCIDEKKRSIYIINGRSVMEFDFDGQYKRSSEYEWSSVLFMPIDTGKFIFYQSNFPDQTKNTVYSWYITDLQCNLQTKFVNFHKRVNKGSRIGWVPLYTFSGNTHLMEFCADTLFYLRNNKQETYAIINLGNMKMDPDPVPTSDRREDYNRLNEKLWPRYINESDRCMFLTLWWGLSDSAGYCVYNKRTQETTFLKDKAFVNDLDGGPSFWPKYIYNDSVLVDFIYADKLIEHMNKKNIANQSISNDLKALGKQLSESSNPILMVLE